MAASRLLLFHERRWGKRLAIEFLLAQRAGEAGVALFQGPGSRARRELSLA